MSWRPHSKAYADPSRPETWGKCDRCQSVYLLRELRWQKQWAGASMVNTRLRVCGRCMDKPQRQLGEKRLSADPQPVKDARPLTAATAQEGVGGVPVADSIGVLIDEPLQVPTD